jgi:hypothetical protein
MAARKPSRSGGIAVALIGWVVVIVVAGGPRSPGTWLGVKNLELVLFAVVAVLLVAGLAILTTLRHLSGWQIPERSSRRGSLVLVLLCLAVLVWRPEILDEITTIEESLRPPRDAAPGLSTEGAPAEKVPVAQVTDIVLLLALLAVTATAALVFRRRQTEPATDGVGSDAAGSIVQVAAALGAASRQLELAENPRTAVFRAYASLEGVAATADVQRRPSETPSEHMSRWLSVAQIDPGPVLDLGRLYERARFSAFTVTEKDRRRAVQSLVTAVEDAKASL